MIVQHNLSAMNANRNLAAVSSAQAKSTEKLSSGYRINRAADDAAGLSISEKMRSQIRGLGQASRNAQDGISLIQTAEGALNESHSILQRMRELAVQAANGTETTDDRQAVNDEITQLQDELTRIAETTEFNTMKLLDGSLGGAGGSSGAGPLFGAIQTQGLTGAIVTSNISGVSITQNISDKTKAGTETAIWSTDGKTLQLNLAENTTYTQGKIDELIKNAKQEDSTADNTVATITVSLKGGAFTTGSAGASLPGVATTAGVKGQTNTHTLTVGAAATNFTGSNAISFQSNKYGTELNGTTFTFKFDQTNGKEYVETVSAIAYDSLNSALAGSYTLHLAAGKEYTAADIEKLLRSAGFDIKVNLDGADPDEPHTIFANSANVADFTLTMNNGAGVSDAKAQFGQDGYGGDSGDGVTLQIGANYGQTMNFGIGDMSAQALGVAGSKVNVSTQKGAMDSLNVIDDAVKKVSQTRGRLGAVQNRLEHTIANLDTAAENTQAAESRIRDLDMAKEMVDFTKNNILAQAGQAMLAQANQSTQGVLSLLG